MKRKGYSHLFFAVIIGFYFFAPAQETNKKIHSTLAEISTCKDRIRLELDRDWENSVGKAGVFSEPRDIEIGKTGDIYVVDSAKKQISVFDSSGRRLRTIGKEGVKPGEFLFPVSLALDDKDNIVVGEDGWRGVRILNSIGKPMGGFRIKNAPLGLLAITRTNKIVLPNTERTFKPSPLLYIYDYQGVILGKRGQRDGDGSEQIFLLKNLARFCTDTQDNLCVAYLVRPLILKFTSNGEPSIEITYELPFRIPEAVNEQDKFVDSEGPFVKCISSDREGNIYIVTQTRLKDRNEKSIGRTRGVTYEEEFVKVSTMKSDIKSEFTNLYQLLVFSSSGKIKASRQFNIFCDQIKVIGDALFCIDTYVAHKIYKYKIAY